MPWMWLIAGPNGSGKSTAVDGNILESLTRDALHKLNADVRTRELRLTHPGLYSRSMPRLIG
jgi:predicted ABC-type ATPase